MIESFDFRFTPLYRAAAAVFGISPSTARVEVGDGRLTARFGRWQLQTEVANISECEVTGDYRRPKTLGPPHLSFSDRGLTFATNPDQGLCMSFREPVGGIDPLHRIRHPALTVTVADAAALRRAIEAG